MKKLLKMANFFSKNTCFGAKSTGFGPFFGVFPAVLVPKISGLPVVGVLATGGC